MQIYCVYAKIHKHISKEWMKKMPFQQSSKEDMLCSNVPFLFIYCKSQEKTNAVYRKENCK